jgi:hypothetical protein
MNIYQVRIWGELTHDDFWELDLGPMPPETRWNDVSLPQCPDCGGSLVWDEANLGPGSLRCAGRRIGGGRPTYCPGGGCGSLFDVDAGRCRVILRRKQFQLT